MRRRAGLSARLVAVLCGVLVPRGSLAADTGELRTLNVAGLRNWQDAADVEYVVTSAHGAGDTLAGQTHVWHAVERGSRLGSLRDFVTVRTGDTVQFRARVGGRTISCHVQVPSDDLSAKGAVPVANILELAPEDDAGVPGGGAGEDRARREGGVRFRLVIVTSPVRHREVAYALWAELDAATDRGDVEGKVVEEISLLWKRAVRVQSGHGVNIMADHLPLEDGLRLELRYEVEGKTIRSTSKKVNQGTVFAGWTVPATAGVIHYRVMRGRLQFGGVAGSAEIPKIGFYDAAAKPPQAKGPAIFLFVHQSTAVMQKFWQAIHFGDRVDRPDNNFWDPTGAWNRDALATLWREMHPSGKEMFSEEFPSEESVAVVDGAPSVVEVVDPNGVGPWYDRVDCDDPKVWLGVPISLVLIGTGLCFLCRPKSKQGRAAGDSVEHEISLAPRSSHGMAVTNGENGTQIERKTDMELACHIEADGSVNAEQGLADVLPVVAKDAGTPEEISNAVVSEQPEPEPISRERGEGMLRSLTQRASAAVASARLLPRPEEVARDPAAPGKPTSPLAFPSVAEGALETVDQAGSNSTVPAASAPPVEEP